jgi:hypothetical protein
MTARNEKKNLPIVRFDEEKYYIVRTTVKWSKPSKRQRCFQWLIQKAQKGDHSKVFQGLQLKNLWTKQAARYGFDHENMDVISRGLGESLIICIDEIRQ